MSQRTLELGLQPAKKVKDTGTIAQGNFLIRSHISFDTVEAKIFTYMLAGIDKDDKEFRKIEFPMAKITTNRGGSGYDQVRKACEGLMNKKINVPNGNKKGSFHLYQIIPDIGLDAGTGLISGTFHPALKPYLLDLRENYTISEIEKLLNLKSGYAHRLFWYLKSYENMKSKYRVESWEEFKNIMLGAETNTYRQNSDFKRFVFEPAFRQVIESGAFYEIKEDAELEKTEPEIDREPTVSYQYITKGKRIITAVRFDFTVSTQQQQQQIQQKKKRILAAENKQKQQQEPEQKYKKGKAPKQNLKATSKLNLLELHEIHKEDFESAIKQRLATGWYWNEDQTILYKD